jgi:hypothetical protein
MCCGKNRQQFLGKPPMSPASRSGRLPASPLPITGAGSPWLAPRGAPTTAGTAMTTLAARQSAHQIARGPQQGFAPAQAPNAFVALNYLERSPIRIRGPVTGRIYEFSGSHPVQPVESRDATDLLRTRFFSNG